MAVKYNVHKFMLLLSKASLRFFDFAGGVKELKFAGENYLGFSFVCFDKVGNLEKAEGESGLGSEGDVDCFVEQLVDSFEIGNATNQTEQAGKANLIVNSCCGEKKIVENVNIPKKTKKSFFRSLSLSPEDIAILLAMVSFVFVSFVFLAIYVFFKVLYAFYQKMAKK